MAKEVAIIRGGLLFEEKHYPRDIAPRSTVGNYYTETFIGKLHPQTLTAAD